MSVKAQYESYRYVGEICRIKSQSIVECRLSGSEINAVLAVHAKAVPAECVCGDGEVNYGGKVLLTVVYEDSDRKICRVERGAEFYHKAENGAVTPACAAKIALTSENVTYRREGSGLYVSVIVGAEFGVYGSKQIEYLTGGEDIVTKNAPICVCRTVCASGELEGEDEFETEYVGDVLLHTQSTIVNRVAVNAGQIEIEGELNLNICVLRSDDTLCSYERLIPFSMQVPCDEAFGKATATARVGVKTAHLTAGLDEEKGRSKMLFSYLLTADCFVSVEEELSVAIDAFSTGSELGVKMANDGGRYLTTHMKTIERVSGNAIISPALEGEYFLQAAVLPRAEISCRKGENGIEAEGAINADLILRAADGGCRTVALTLPFAFPVEYEGEELEAECLVCGLNVRRKKNGETEAEGLVKVCFRCYKQREWAYVEQVTEGEKRIENESAFSVFIPRAGEDLWQVSKRLRCAPADLQRTNPDLEFPIKEDKRIFIYRQIK